MENSIDAFEILKDDMSINMVLTAITAFGSNIRNVLFTRTDMINKIGSQEQPIDFEISPNPSNQNINISFQLENKEKVLCELILLAEEKSWKKHC